MLSHNQAERSTYPIHEALNWHLTRFGQQARPTQFAALLRNEDDSVWQAKLKEPLTDYKKDKPRKYESPAGLGSKAYFPPIDALTWLNICIRNDAPLPEPVKQWLQGLNTCSPALQQALARYCDTLGQEQTLDQLLNQTDKPEQDLWLQLLMDDCPHILPETWNLTLKMALLSAQMLHQFYQDLAHFSIPIDGFWQWTTDNNLTITLTEGGKKGARTTFPRIYRHCPLWR